MTPMTKNDWKHAGNILCIRADNMGDVIMATPAFRALKESFPGVRLALLTSSAGAKAAPYLRDIDRTIIADLPWIKAAGPVTAPARLADELKQAKFDAAVIFNNFSQSSLPPAMLAYMAGIPLRLGYSRENPYRLLTDWVPDREPFITPVHGVKRQIDLVSSIGAKAKDNRLLMDIPSASRRSLKKILSVRGAALETGYIVVHPGVSEDKRRFPAAKLAEGLAELRKYTDAPVFLTGLEEDRQWEQTLLQASGPGSFSLIGQLDVGQLAALIQGAELLISNNTGVVHIASALQVPTVVLYARTNPEHVPWMNRSRLLYFDVPREMHSRNQVLAFVIPPSAKDTVRPAMIAWAALELLGKAKGGSRIPEEVASW